MTKAKPKAPVFPVGSYGHVPYNDYASGNRCSCCHKTWPAYALQNKVPSAGRILHPK